MTISNNFLKNFLQNFSIKKSPPFYRQEHIHDKKNFYDKGRNLVRRYKFGDYTPKN